MTTRSTTTVALVDDHTLVRKGLVSIVNDLDGYTVVLEAANGKEFIELLHDGPQVDIAIVDLNMPVMDGYATIGWISKHRAATKSIALTFDAREDAVVRAVRAGARGFLLKTVDPPVFKLALDVVRDGGYYGNDAADRHAENYEALTSFERLQKKMLEEISPRELEFIRLACQPEEHTFEEIARRMDLAASTVEKHRKRVYERFGIKSKAGLVIFAYRYGIVKARIR